jgi:hypothetical protein
MKLLKTAGRRYVRLKMGRRLAGVNLMKDPDPRVRSRAARAVASHRPRGKVGTCEYPPCGKTIIGYLDVEGPKRKRFCSKRHSIARYRQQLKERGYTRVSRNGKSGYLSPDGRFVTNPSAEIHVQQQRTAAIPV